MMTPDFEALLIEYLRGQYQALGMDAPVSTHVPGERPGLFTRVQLTGGQRSQLVIALGELAIQCWGPDDVQASNLARLTESMVLDLHGNHSGVWVRNVSSMGGISYFPDPESTQPRYQFAVQVNVRPQERPAP